MFYENSGVAMSSLSVKGYACLMSPTLILAFIKELSELGPGYRISWTVARILKYYMLINMWLGNLKGRNYRGMLCVIQR